jgi:MFS family permease
MRPDPTSLPNASERLSSAVAARPLSGRKLFGRLGDVYGRRRIFLIGVSLLAAASLLGGISTGPALLLAARVLQGVASAMAVPAALSLLITTFADERQRAWVLGLSGSLLSAGFTIGAIAGGMLVGVLSWRWALLINVPLPSPFLHSRRPSCQRSVRPRAYGSMFQARRR